MEFTVQEIVAAARGELLAGCAEARAGRVVTDTRALAPGETFLALRGERFDGHDFLREAVERGAACLVVHDEKGVRTLFPEKGVRTLFPEGRRAEKGPGTFSGPAVVRVGDTLAALGALAQAARQRLRCPVVAVTGSCGKTTAKEMIGQVLRPHLKGRTPPKSFNNQIGVPLTLLEAEPGDEFVLCELGTNAPGEISALAALARPAIGVVTLVAPVHLEGLGSIEGIAREKAALVEALPPEGVAVLNADNPYVAAMAAKCRARVLTVGLEKDADLRGRDAAQTAQGLRFRAGGVGFELPVVGRHHVVLALAAAAVGRELGVPLERAAEALRAFRPPPMRLAIRQAGDVTVINDAYNASPQSMQAALEVLGLWPERRKVFFCGDMRELGAASAAAHEALGRQVVRAGVGRLIAVGAETEATARAAVAAGLAAEAVERFADAAQAAAVAAKRVRAGDVVLVKGSRAMRMEQIAEALLERAGALGGAGPGHAGWGLSPLFAAVGEKGDCPPGPAFGAVRSGHPTQEGGLPIPRRARAG